VEKIPFFALAAAVSVVTFLVQQQAGAVLGAERLPVGARVANALISYGRYLEKLFWPTNLAVYYPRPGPPAGLHQALEIHATGMGPDLVTGNQLARERPSFCG
jgi:hypothetical protein